MGPSLFFFLIILLTPTGQIKSIEMSTSHEDWGSCTMEHDEYLAHHLLPVKGPEITFVTPCLETDLLHLPRCQAE